MIHPDIQPNRIALDGILPCLHQSAIDAFMANDFETFYGYASSEDSFELYSNNLDNLYCGYNVEKAFLAMWTNEKRGLGELVPVEHIHSWLYFFNKRALRKLGDPIPEGESFTLFRGVHAGVPKSEYGISWTDDKALACWFAVGFNSCYRDNVPAVYTTTVRRGSILAYVNESGRNEREYLIVPRKPKLMDMSLEAMQELSKQHVESRK